MNRSSQNPRSNHPSSSPPIPHSPSKRMWRRMDDDEEGGASHRRPSDSRPNEHSPLNGYQRSDPRATHIGPRLDLGGEIVTKRPLGAGASVDVNVAVHIPYPVHSLLPTSPLAVANLIHPELEPIRRTGSRSPDKRNISNGRHMSPLPGVGSLTGSVSPPRSRRVTETADVVSQRHPEAVTPRIIKNSTLPDMQMGAEDTAMGNDPSPKEARERNRALAQYPQLPVPYKRARMSFPPPPLPPSGSPPPVHAASFAQSSIPIPQPGQIQHSQQHSHPNQQHFRSPLSPRPPLPVLAPAPEAWFALGQPPTRNRNGWNFEQQEAYAAGWEDALRSVEAGVVGIGGQHYYQPMFVRKQISPPEPTPGVVATANNNAGNGHYRHLAIPVDHPRHNSHPSFPGQGVSVAPHTRLEQPREEQRATTHPSRAYGSLQAPKTEYEPHTPQSMPPRMAVSPRTSLSSHPLPVPSGQFSPYRSTNHPHIKAQEQSSSDSFSPWSSENQQPKASEHAQTKIQAPAHHRTLSHSNARLHSQPFPPFVPQATPSRYKAKSISHSPTSPWSSLSHLQRPGLESGRGGAPGSHAQGQDQSPGQGAERLSRQPISCFNCRAKKLKCDGNKPCSQCIRRAEDGACEFAPSVRRRGKGKRVITEDGSDNERPRSGSAPGSSSKGRKSDVGLTGEGDEEGETAGQLENRREENWVANGDSGRNRYEDQYRYRDEERDGQLRDGVQGSREDDRDDVHRRVTTA